MRAIPQTLTASAVWQNSRMNSGHDSNRLQTSASTLLVVEGHLSKSLGPVAFFRSTGMALLYASLENKNYAEAFRHAQANDS
jgi:hypothetical protein